MKKSSADHFKLSTGKVFYANNNIIGISPNLAISEGYDGGLWEKFTLEERKEIADYMIDLWRKFAEGENSHDPE